MHISVKQLLLTIAIATLSLPLIVSWFSLPSNNLINLGLVIAQVACAGQLLITHKQTSSRSLKIFWQYLGFAVLCALASNLIQFDTSVHSQLLTMNFFSLFVYFFIFLAIETNPHSSNLPLNKYISGRMPAIFFTVICFSYLVLLPLEFTDSYAQAQPSILLFHVLISALITAKLIWSTFNSQGKNWMLIYGLLSVSAILLLSKHISMFNNLVTAAPDGYSTSLFYLSVLPIVFLALASALSNKLGKTPAVMEKENRHEAYILLLVLTLTVLHLVGKELSLFYIVNSQLQSIIAVIWLIVGAVMVLAISYGRRKQNQKLNNKLHSLLESESQLDEKNRSLLYNLKNSEDKAIVGVSNNAILTTSIEGNILSANPAAVQMFQYLEQELVGSKVSKLFAEQDEMHYFFDFQSNVFSLQRKEAGISLECSSVRSDGTEFPAQAELQWAEREQMPLIVITFINLSARKLAEKQALELKDKFIANISHEFRTPLTIINGIIDRYIGQTADSNETQELTTAKRNGLRLVRMVEQLLELSRVSDNPKLNLVTYKLSTLMSMPIDSFSRLATQSNIEFNSQVPEDLWVECDAQAFEKIIFNLLANAIKYTPTGGTVRVNAYEDQDSIILDIIDSGIGISKDNQSKIFERFQRADDANNQAIFGVGIGLSLVNELVKAHGWRINLVSEQGQGSKFSLSMPIASALTVEESVPIGLSEHEVNSLLTEQPTVSNSQVNHSQQVVLVIEDNADMQSHIKQVVEQNHHCILAGSGELGLQLAQEYVPDLIVCDLMLPGIDGFDVLKSIKQHELTAHIPVILLTARSDLESRLQGLNLNADEYLSKPFNHHELLTRIQNLIDNRKQLQQRYLVQFNKEQKTERREVSQSNAAKLTTETVEDNFEDKFLAKLEAQIAKLYTDPTLDISRLAKELAMSERQLQRKMKVMLDSTPNNFIKEFRLKKAQALLASGAQIGRIAMDVGFSSQTYFGRCFKETYNCTPKQYQQQISQSDD